MQPFNLFTIPLELKTMANWVGHRTKIPINLKTGLTARSNDKSTWVDFVTAVQNYGNYNCEGLGFCFEEPLIGFDLDDCIENGKINPFGKNLIDICDSYTEYSPSGTGIHIICKGILPRPIKTSILEVYQNGRFFTMTGNRVSKHSLIRQIDDLSFLYPEGYNKPQRLNERLNSIAEGNRNNTLTGIAGSLRAKGYRPEEIYELLLPKAREVQLSEKELSLLCMSVGRYEPNNISANGSSIEEFLKNIEVVDWLVPGIIAKKSINFVAGLNGTMKTWMLIDLAIECAKEKEGLWLGRFSVNHAKVLFVDQERFKGETQRRFKAVLAGKEITTNAVGNNLFIRCGTTTRLDLPHSFEAFKKELKDLTPDLVIIDSFATFHTKNENFRQEIQIVFERLKELRNEFGCSFVFIHHENGTAYNTEEDRVDTGQMSGSEAIPAAAEMVLTVRKQSLNTSMVYMTKNNLSNAITPFIVTVEDLDIEKSKIKCYTI